MNRRLGKFSLLNNIIKKQHLRQLFEYLQWLYVLIVKESFAYIDRSSNEVIREYFRNFCILFDVHVIIVEDDLNVVSHRQCDVQQNYKEFHLFSDRMNEENGLTEYD